MSPRLARIVTAMRRPYRVKRPIFGFYSWVLTMTVKESFYASTTTSGASPRQLADYRLVVPRFSHRCQWGMR